MRTEGTDTVLYCGHKESERGSITVGYGVDKDGKAHCYACCLKEDLRFMRRVGRCTAYLSEDSRKITTWPGEVISDKVLILSKGRDSFGGERTYFRFMFDGQVWSGFGMGPGMYLRAKRTKIKSLYA